MGYIRITISISEETKKRIEEIAKRERRSLSNMINYILEKYKD